MKTKEPKCIRCGHLEYLIGNASDKRPQFKCTKCEYEWTAGLNGGLYMTSKFAKDARGSEADYFSPDKKTFLPKGKQIHE